MSGRSSASTQSHSRPKSPRVVLPPRPTVRRVTDTSKTVPQTEVVEVASPKPPSSNKVSKHLEPPSSAETPTSSIRLVPKPEKTPSVRKSLPRVEPPASVKRSSRSVKPDSPKRNPSRILSPEKKSPPEKVAKVPTRQASPERIVKVPTRQASPRRVASPVREIPSTGRKTSSGSSVTVEEEEQSLADDSLWHWVSNPEMIWADHIPDFDSLDETERTYLRDKYYSTLLSRVTEGHITASHMAKIDWRNDPLSVLHIRYREIMRNLQISRKKKTTKGWIFGWFIILELFVKKMLEIDVSGYTKLQMANTRYDEYLYELAARSAGGKEEDWHPVFSIFVVSLVQLVVMALIHHWLGGDNDLLKLVGGKEKVMDVVSDLATSGRIDQIIDENGEISTAKIVKAVVGNGGGDPPYEE